MSQAGPESPPTWDKDDVLLLSKRGEGLGGTAVPCTTQMLAGGALTVEAWVDAKDGCAERLQALVSQWSPLTTFDTFDAFDAANTNGLNSAGYFGAVFDGRYVYFVPEQHEGLGTHGIVLRYDTHGDFKDAGSYAAYDAGCTGGMNTSGYYGAVFDGTYVYFVPWQTDMTEYHSRVLRLDTRGEFKDPEAWEAFDIGRKHSSQSAAFDGRYIYFSPGFSGDPHTEDTLCGEVMRYDTQGDFHLRDSYDWIDISAFLGPRAACFDGAAFDGRYAYFVPLMNGLVVRCDTTGDFRDRKSWQAFDAAKLKMGMCVGAVFDGRFLYFVPYCGPVVVRFDTSQDFEDPASWSTHDVNWTRGLKTGGCDGGYFDGRYVYFVPFVYGSKAEGYTFHSNYLRYDATGEFGDPDSWDAHDASEIAGLHSVGYNAGAFDGRFFYAAPWRYGPRKRPGTSGIHGTVLRCDTLGANGSFSLRYCDYGHNGGLCAAVPGPSFLVNTDSGVLSASAHRVMRPGSHHLGGVFDGRTIRLYVDGVLAAERPGAGQIAGNALDIAIGKVQNGLAKFDGCIRKVRISRVARDEAWMRAACSCVKSER